MGWCNLTALALGLWHLGNLNPPYDAWSGCPAALKAVTDDKFVGYSIKDHITKYSCKNQSSKHATFQPYHCELLSPRQSFKQIHTMEEHHQQTLGNRKRIVYVGDSLVAQTYVAAMCSHEQHNKQQSEFTFTYLKELFLRADIPCHPSCLNNSKLYLANIHNLSNPCGACPEGKLTVFADHKIWSKRLEDNVPNDTLALVIGVGSWFNNFQGVINSTKEFATTVYMIKPLLLHLIHDRQIHVFWHGLPPIALDKSVHYQGFRYTYEWFGYEEKDAIAKSVFASTPIHFLDVGRLTRKRREMDHSIGADHVHWCNPGAHSIPTFINQIIFHTLTTIMMQQQPRKGTYVPHHDKRRRNIS
jgi:hypothetical protein